MVLANDKRAKLVVVIAAAAAVSVLTFYYPAWIANRNVAPDDRLGFFLLWTKPLHLLAGVGAIVAFLQLLLDSAGKPIRGRIAVILVALLLTLLSAATLVIPFNTLFRK